MVHHKSNVRREKSSLILLAALFFLGSVSGSSLDHNSIDAIKAINTIKANNHRYLQENTLVITDAPEISEAYNCIPASEIKRIHESPDPRLPWGNGNSGAIQKECYLQQNLCGSATAPSACCRVSFEAGWLVCDAYNAFDFMPCVCNDNTFGTEPPTKAPTPTTTSEPTTGAPTKSPTVAPTASPTLSPTVAPTQAPTFSPTALPTAKVVPTMDPTTGTPTVAPTNAPVVNPTEAPVTATPTASPTAAPTTSPTVAPTVPPTASPTTSPTGSPTPLPTVSPTKAPVTQAPTVPPTSFPTKTPVTPAPTQFPTAALGYTTEDRFDAEIDDMIRQSQCKADPPVLQFVQASTFTYRYEVTVLEGTSGADGVLLNDLWKDSIHDEIAREFLICDGYDKDTIWILQSKTHLVDESTPCSGEDSNDSSSCLTMVAEARIIVYKSPIADRVSSTKSLWGEFSYEEGETAKQFANAILGFLEDRLNSGDDGLGFAPNFGVVFQGGEIVEIDDPSEDNTDTDSTEDSVGDSTGSGETDTNGGSDGNGESGNNSDGGTSDSGEPVTDDIDLTGSDILWADNPTQTGTVIGLETGQATTSRQGRLTPAMIATIAAVAACVLLIVVLGAVARKRRNNREFREDEEYLQDVTTPRSDKYYSSHPVDHLDLSDSESSGPDIERNAATSYGPTTINSHRGRKFQPPKSPLHFNFSGIVGNPTSPTSRERSRMGPLGNADEFRQSRSGSEQINGDSEKGSHRGIVSNSSSMSSNANNNDLPPPHQHTSPRLYNLRDTINL